MNSYITLGAKKFRTLEDWQVSYNNVMSLDFTLLGVPSAAYGSATIAIYSGTISVDVNESESGYGSVADIEGILSSKAGIAFSDHDGHSTTVHISNWDYVPMAKWSSPINRYFYSVKLMGKKGT